MGLDTAARAKVTQHLGLVKHVAKGVRFHDSVTTFEDICQDGALGLIDAVRRNIRGEGVSASYLKVRIRGEIIDRMRSWAWSSRAQFAEGAESQPGYLEDLVGFDIAYEDDFERIETRADIERMFMSLPKPLTKQEVYVLRRYFYDDVPLWRIGEELGLTEGRMSQVKTRALQRLREVA